MKKLILCLLGLSCSAIAEEPVQSPVLQKHAASAQLLQKNPICLEANGEVDIPFDDACRILTRPDFLDAIQDAYTQTLPVGEKPEFTVERVAPAKYHYVNCKQQETTIEEISRTLIPSEKAELILYSEGVRFFGAFQSVCQIEVVDSGPGRAAYSITVYAHPENMAVRWFARVSPVETFFRYKTRHLTDLVVDVCEKILESDPQKNGVVFLMPNRQGGS